MGLRPQKVTSVTANSDGNRPLWALRARCRPAPTPFTGAGTERSAKADHGPAAPKGDFSHHQLWWKSPSLGASRPVSACADTLWPAAQ